MRQIWRSLWHSSNQKETSDVLTLRQSTLPMIAIPVALVGWLWLVRTLVLMGGEVILSAAVAPTALFVCGLLALERRTSSTTLATLILLAGMSIAGFWQSWLDITSWGPYVFVLVVAVTGLMLRPTSGLLSAGLCSMVILFAGRYGLSGGGSWQSLAQPVALVCLTAAVSFLAARNLYHALDWAWENAILANQRLEEARDRKEALNRTLRSLDEMYELLHRAQHEEANARVAAEEGQRLKAQFASTVSHELRTPLNAIIGFSELMHTAPEVYGNFAWPPALRSDANEIYRNAVHLQRLIDDILDLAQIDAMRMELMEEKADLGDLIRDTVAAASGLVRSKDVQIKVALQEIPAVYLDPTRIRQVLLNLLSNACRFTEHGQIVVSGFVEQQSVHITVADTGIGMSGEQLRRAFREFEQADGSLRRRYGGTGLGLAISKRFVEIHGGDIWAESTLGAGTTVHFRLPLAHETAVNARPVERTEHPSDEAEVRNVIIQGGVSSGLRLLTRYIDDYHFIASSSRAETVSMIAYHPWAVVVASESPSEADAVAAAIGSANPGFDVPVVSYLIDAADTDQLPQGVEWFSKPVKRAELLAALKRLSPHCRRILVVDDNPTDVQLLARMLRTADRDYAVQEARGGEEAMHILTDNPPDAVLLDLIMPEISGLQVAAWVRAQPGLAGLPVLMVTAGDVSAQFGPLRAPNVRRLSLVKNGEMKTQEWLAGLKALLDAAAPRYVGSAGTPESNPADQSE